MKKILGWIWLGGWLAASAFAQGPELPDFDLSKEFAILFGKDAAFSATMSFKVVGGEDDGTEISGKFALLDGNSRHELDIAQFKSKQIPEEAAAQMQAMGMGKFIVLSRPDKKMTYQIFPALKAYVAHPIKQARPHSKEPKVEKTELGKETIENHPCIKQKVVVTEEGVEPQQFITWNATDLDGLMIQVQFQEGESTRTLRFSDVKRSKPPADLFEPPADFTPYNDLMEMMMKEMMKRGGGG
jgi:hypothetical protein